MSRLCYALQRMLMLCIATAFASSLLAVTIDESKLYRIVCAQNPSGTLCLGSEHNSSCFLIHNPDYDGKCQDAFWHIKAMEKDRYAIFNAKTGEYITYNPVRIENVCKGLALTKDFENEASLWHFEDVGDGYCTILTDYDGVVLNSGLRQEAWNMRLDGTNLVGTFSPQTTANARFALIAASEEESSIFDETPLYTVLEGGDDAFVIRQTGGRLTVVPTAYVEDIAIEVNTITLSLINGAEETLTQCVSIDRNAYPDDTEMPAFASYKFSNKTNYQLSSDVTASAPAATDIALTVAGIGKWLTATFQLSHEGAVAYIGDVLQESKVTRQRFDEPMVYTVGYKTWRRLELRQYNLPQDAEKADAADVADAAEADIRVAYMPYGRQQTVTVDWLTDHPTGAYDVPRIDILLTDHPNAQWGNHNTSYVDEYFWIGQNGKSTYENAEITIDGGGVFPDMAATPILIKGRGNSTWQGDSKSKNPYHFKFLEKQRPLGLTKGKHWVLLSNKQAGSMLTNAIGHRVADMMNVAAPCHIIPVELYINGSYRGSYNLCERVGFAGNSVVVDDDTYAAMVELDTYADERREADSWYGVMTKVKDPDVDEADYTGPLTFERIMQDWNNMLSHLSAGDDICPYVDARSVASFLAANEMIMNCELKHAKSTFAYSANVTDGFSVEAGGDATPWIFGPLWDCDWGYGYEQRHDYFAVECITDYFDCLLGGDSNGAARRMWMDFLANPTINREYYYTWYEFATNRLPELLDFCDEYYEYARRSLTHNRQNETSSTDASCNYAAQVSKAKTWLARHADFVLSRLTAYDLPTPPAEPDPVYPDPDAPVTSSLTAVTPLQPSQTVRPHAVYDLQGRRVGRNPLFGPVVTSWVIIGND